MRIDKIRLKLTFLFIIIAIRGFGQSSTFEGIVTYSHVDNSLVDISMKNPIDIETVYFSAEKMINRVTQGDLLSVTGNTALFFDASSMKRYKINYDRKSIVDIGEEKDKETMNVIVMEKLKDEKILSFLCNVFLLKYVHSFEAIGSYGPEVKSDTLTTKYYVSKDYKIQNVKAFAILQGNRNTKLLDGRFEGVPLKIEIKRQDRSQTTILAVNVEVRSIDEFLDWSAFTKR
ncbi:MAG: hypothetical protein ACKVOQ_06590 [Cyclobacteriaceae bacterium]